MTKPADLVGKVVILRTMGGGYHGIGFCAGYDPSPTVLIRTRDGQRFSWPAHLTEIVEGLPDNAANDLFPYEP